MSGNARIGSFLNGLASATIGLGCFLAVVWAGLWVLGALGGPQWQMPLKILYSSGSLIFIGSMLRGFFAAQSGARSN
jgi:hypothetical protein